MSRDAGRGAMRIQLAGERRARVRDSVRQYFAEELDEELSDFRIEGLIDFFVSELGPPVYNQAVRDVHDFLEKKLADLDVEFYEPEEPYAR